MTVRVSKRNAKKRRRSKSRKKAKESLFKRLFSRSRSKRRRRSKSKKKHRRRRARSKSKRSKSKRRKRSKSKRRQSKRASERRMLGRIHDEVADFIEDNSDVLAYGLEAVAVMAGVVQLAKYLLPKAHKRYNVDGSRYKKFYDYLMNEEGGLVPRMRGKWSGLVPRMRDKWSNFMSRLRPSSPEAAPEQPSMLEGPQPLMIEGPQPLMIEAPPPAAAKEVEKAWTGLDLR